MSWHSYSVRDLGAIALGGVAGSMVRHRIATREAIDAVLVFDPPELADTDIQMPILEGGNLLISVYGIPYGTAVVNLLGCLLLGALTIASVIGATRRRWVLGAAVGFCGSLTTFSTFALDAARLLRGRPGLVERYPEEATYFDPAFGDSMIYLVLSVIGGGLAFWIGRRVAQEFATPTRDLSPGESS